MFIHLVLVKMSGFKVGDQYRTNDLSFSPGGVTVTVDYKDGRRMSYDKVKYPGAFIKKVMKDPLISRAYVNR